jgi:hypothetical protein
MLNAGKKVRERRSRIFGIWWPAVSRSAVVFIKTTTCPKENTHNIVFDSTANRLFVYPQFAGYQISEVLAFVVYIG